MSKLPFSERTPRKPLQTNNLQTQMYECTLKSVLPLNAYNQLHIINAYADTLQIYEFY